MFLKKKKKKLRVSNRPRAIIKAPQDTKRWTNSFPSPSAKEKEIISSPQTKVKNVSQDFLDTILGSD